MAMGKTEFELNHSTAAGPALVAAASRVARILAGRGDLLLALLMMMVIALFVVPLPPMLLDALIAMNLTASISLLMLALYIPSALGLSTFPALLLLTTLFRLSLNIASTKQILLNGSAGEVIETFGRLVVGGNVVVGLVVFLIIALVQFIVIAKGAERVAEVGARFSLDGMPGRQMSIDADMRAGIIDKDEAQRRRREVQEESQLHGAMDGAMKFVKGDAVAGVIIALVNILAGIAIGATMHGMAIGEAIRTYSVLSVGDGMVAQIPSLFVSVAAGIIITRVDGRTGVRNALGAQIMQQVLGHPTALLMAGAMVATFLLVPGLPVLPFVAMSALLVAAGWFGRRRMAAKEPQFAGAALDSAATADEHKASMQADAQHDPIAVPLRLCLAANLKSSLSAPSFNSALALAKSAVGIDLGLPMPDLQLRFDETLTVDGYSIQVQEMPVAHGVVPATDAEQHLANEVAAVVRRHADAFIGIQETHALLTRAGQQLPELTAELQRSVPLQRISEVLRRLVQEGVSIRYVREICESLLVWSSREKDIVILTEYVRVDLGKFIARRYVDGNNDLRAFVMDAEAEKVVREAIQQGPAGSFLSLAPEKSQALMIGADRAFAAWRNGSGPILLASMEVRRYVKRFLELRFPALSVLSYQELPAEVQIHTLGTLALAQSQQRKSA